MEMESDAAPAVPLTAEQVHEVVRVLRAKAPEAVRISSLAGQVRAKKAAFLDFGLPWSCSTLTPETGNPYDVAQLLPEDQVEAILELYGPPPNPHEVLDGQPLSAEKIAEIANLLENKGGTLLTSSVAGAVRVKPKLLQGDHLPWHFFQGPDGQFWIQQKGAEDEAPPVSTWQPQFPNKGKGKGACAGGYGAMGYDSPTRADVGPYYYHGSFDKGKGWGKCAGKSAGGAPPQVEMFIQIHAGLDPNVAQALRELPLDFQKAVINKGSLFDARDMNAVLMSRINQSRQLIETGGPAQLPGSQVSGLRPGDWICPGCGDHQFAKNTSCRQCATMRPALSQASQGLGNGEFGGVAVSPQVEMFIQMNSQLQPHAAQALRELPLEMQKMVVNKGSLNDARDPTAVLISRVNQARQLMETGMAGALQAGNPLLSSGRPGDWICPGCMDHQFAKNTHCRQCNTPKPQGDQSFGNTWGAAQPTAAMNSALAISAMTSSIEDSAVETFLQMHDQVEPRAAQMLRDLPPEFGKLVVNKGSLFDARDQTAVLVSRIKQAQQLMTGQGAGNPLIGSQRPGDWICPGCMDHQFAKNTTCRRCGTPNPSLGMGAGMSEPSNNPEVEHFLASNSVEPHAATQFRGLPAHVQTLVMSRGSLAGARDPTAVLMARMRQAKSGEMQSGRSTNHQEPKEGDWYCPNCNDLQFKRNNICRNCQTPKPAGAGMPGAAAAGFGEAAGFGAAAGWAASAGWPAAAFDAWQSFLG